LGTHHTTPFHALPHSPRDRANGSGIAPPDHDCEGVAMRKSALTVVVALSSVLACVPKRDLPPDQIEKLGQLSDVMDVQATVADPQFSKIGKTSFTDDDWAAFADLATRLRATTKKSKEFSKGPEFDDFVDRLGTKAEALATAASAKDASRASSVLTEMKATCKGCHVKFR
jgi:hypothetical protein